MRQNSWKKIQTDASVIVEEPHDRMKKNATANKDFEKLRDLKMQLDASQTKKISKSNLKGKPAARGHFTAMNAWSSMTNTDKKQEEE